MQCNSSFTHRGAHEDRSSERGDRDGDGGLVKRNPFERTRPPPKRPINGSSMHKKSDPTADGRWLMADGWSQKANVNTINHRFDSLSACFSICAFDYVPLPRTHTLSPQKAHQLIHLQQIVCSGARGRCPLLQIGLDRIGSPCISYLHPYPHPQRWTGAGPLD